MATRTGNKLRFRSKGKRKFLRRSKPLSRKRSAVAKRGAQAVARFVATGNLTASAEERGVSRSFLRKLIRTSRIALWDGQQWRYVEREVRVITQERVRWIKVGFGTASLVGSHNEAIKRFLRANDVSILDHFKGQVAVDLRGRKYPLETCPNVLYRLAARGSEGFEQVYRRTA